MPSWKKVIISGSDAALRSLNVSTTFTASGLNYPISDNGEESFMQTDGSGNLTFQYVKTIYEQIYNGEATTITKGTPVYVSGSVGAASIVYRADAGNASKMPVIYIAADNIASGATGRGIALGLITGVNTTGYPPGTEIYVAVGGGWTSTRPTGSAIVQTLGYVTKEGNGGQGVVLNPGPNSLPNLPSGSVWVGNSNSIPVAVPTSSLNVASSSYALTSSYTTAISGTDNYVPKFNGTSALENSLIYDDGTSIGIGTTTPQYSVDVQGNTITNSSVSVQGAFNINPVTAPTAISGYTLSAGTSLGVGQYYYRVVYVTSIGETNAGSSLSVVTTTGNTTVNLTGIPTSSDPRVIARKIYRTKLNATNDNQFFLATINNNTSTTYTDSIADTSLTGVGLQYYKINTTSRYFTVAGVQSMILDANLVTLGRNAGNSLISSNSTAIRTVLIGPSAGQNITTGVANVIVGVAGINITTGGSNSILGDLAGYAITTGNNNSILGVQAARYLTTGASNVIIGSNAGSTLADGTTQFTQGTNNTIVGTNTKMLTVSDTNSTVIGNNAVGLGSNSVVLGNDSIITTALKGNIGIGTTSPNAKLDVNGNTIITGSLAVSQSLLQYSNITSVTSGSTSNVASFNTGSYTAAFFDFVTTSGTNTRAGTIFTVWNGNNVEFTETSTNDIGSTSNLTLSASLSAGAIRLQATSLSGSWSVKTLARMI